jgi:integrase/predicted DNA-binding transcriptional regulator AlpA
MLIPAQFESSLPPGLLTGIPAQLLSLPELCALFKVSRSWVYKRTKKGAIDPLPVIRIGGLKFDPEQVRQYIAARQRPARGATLTASDGNARVNGKAYRSLTRKRFQTGYVRLREDRKPAWWEGFYREDVVNDSGRVERKRKSVNLGLQSEIPTKRSAQRKLAEILADINDLNYRPRSTLTFGAFVKNKYRELTMPTKKGTTQNGYEVNLRKHFLPFFGDLQLCDIDTETVQAFLNQKIAAGYAHATLKNLKWGLSSVLAAAVKFGYIKSNPVSAADLPPEGIKEEATLPSGAQLELLIMELPESIGMAVWLVAVTCIRPEELAFKWSDLDVEKRQLRIIRAVNRGKLHTPKYHRSNRPIQLTEGDVKRLLAMKKRMNANDDDWMFPNSRNTGPLWHEDVLGRVIQPTARKLNLPHITWRLLRHWGTTQMVENRVPIKAAQQRLGHTRPDLLLKHYTHVLDESAQFAAETLSSQLSGKTAKKQAKPMKNRAVSRGIGSQTAANSKKWVM